MAEASVAMATHWRKVKQGLKEEFSSRGLMASSPRTDIDTHVRETVRDPQLGPAALLFEAEKRELVHAALLQLPGLERELIIDIFFEGQSEAVVAKKFSLEAGEIKKSLQAAFVKLAPILAGKL